MRPASEIRSPFAALSIKCWPTLRNCSHPRWERASAFMAPTGRESSQSRFVVSGAATGGVFQVRPSFLMPYLIGKTDQVEKALYLRQFDVPFEALAYVFGRDPMDGYRAWCALGRPAIVGTPVKDPSQLPKHRVADEKHTWLEGEKVYVATTAAGGSILGAELTESASANALEKAYGVFAASASRHFTI